MANERIPEDPYRRDLSGDECASRQLSTMNCSPTPNSPRVPASGGRIAIFAVGIAVVLGAVFYGLNNTSVEKAGTSPTAQTAQSGHAAKPLRPRRRHRRPRRLRACVTSPRAPIPSPA